MEKEMGLSLGLAVFAIFLSSVYFPYDFLLNYVPVIGKLICQVQFPFRYLAPVSLFVAWLICMPAREARWSRWLPLLCVAVGIQSALYVGSALDATEIFEIKGNADISSFEVSGAEYIPFGTNYELLDRQPLAEEGIRIDGSSRSYNRIKVALENTASQDGLLEIPLIYYRGYVARDTNTGLKLTTENGKDNRIQVVVPSGYIGEITVAFEEPLYWRAAEAVSIIFLVGLLIAVCCKNKVK
nr:hypothetical protein [uncultured Eisenbergiella sp.]